MITGYEIQFTGALRLDRPLLPEHAAYLDRFVHTRRVVCSVEHIQHISDPLREAVDLPLGPEGAYFVGIDFDKERVRQPMVLNMNRPPQGQPDLWCHWRFDPDHMTLRYTANRNLYLSLVWLQYLLDHFLLPWDYQIQGEMRWQGEDEEDRGSITVKEQGAACSLDQVARERHLALPDETIDCLHKEAVETRLVCTHLAGCNPENSFYQWFTGVGKQYFLICELCAANGQSPEATYEFRQVCWRCFKELEGAGWWSGIVGQPEMLVRPSSLTITQQRVPFPLAHPLRAFEPIDTRGESAWIALTAQNDLIHVDLTSQTTTHLMCLPPSQLDVAQQVSLRLAPGGEIAAIVNTNGQHGIVVNLRTGKATMQLSRDTYHIEHSSFPLAFCVYEDRLLLVHGTAWNRLDFSDPYTGELLSTRISAESSATKHPAHYLDYFHASLSISPKQEWIVDNGWVWSPVGQVTAWNLRQWVGENVWESEDGPSLRTLCLREYYWDGPLCWIDGQTLAIWGYGEDDAWLIPAVRLFDVSTGRETGWFAGPERGMFVFDEYLFSCSEEHGLCAWDVATGERVGWVPDFCPTHYHRGSRQFLRLDVHDGTVQIGTLTTK